MVNYLSVDPGHPKFGCWGLLCLAAALAGCGRNDAQAYRVAKEPAPPEAAAPGLPAGHPDTSGGQPKLQYKAPAGWQEVAPGEIRVASFRVAGAGGKQADVSVVPLPGQAGSDLDNVNRWRGQVGLPPVAAEELPRLAQPVEIGRQAAQLYEQAGPVPGSGETNRILAAVLRRGGIAWFFKMTGDDGLVAQQKPVFEEFLKSLNLAAPAGPSDLPPSHPPIGGAGMTPASAPMSGMATPGPAKPDWKVPPGWEEVPGGQFLAAKFIIHGSGAEQAAVNVSSSPGEGGGFLGNVNRWRQQLGLAQLTEGEADKLATPLEVQGGKAMVVDMSGSGAGTGQKTRLIGAVIRQADRTWFYKLMGSEPVVEREKAAFTQFVRTAQYAGPKQTKDQ
jgi:hypothetical protein